MFLLPFFLSAFFPPLMSHGTSSLSSSFFLFPLLSFLCRPLPRYLGSRPHGRLLHNARQNIISRRTLSHSPLTGARGPVSQSSPRQLHRDVRSISWLLVVGLVCRVTAP